MQNFLINRAYFLSNFKIIPSFKNDLKVECELINNRSTDDERCDILALLSSANKPRCNIMKYSS